MTTASPTMLAHLPTAFIDGIGGPELVMIFLVVLVLYGGKGLPDIARAAGKLMRDFKKATRGVEEQIKHAMDEEPPAAVRRPRPQPAPKPVEPLPAPEKTETDDGAAGSS